ACGQRHERDDEDREDRAGYDPADETEPCDEAAPKTELRAQRRRFRALRFEVEQLAALVTDVRDDTEQQSDEREPERGERGSDERQHRSARERLRTKLREEVSP